MGSSKSDGFWSAKTLNQSTKMIFLSGSIFLSLFSAISQSFAAAGIITPNEKFYEEDHDGCSQPPVKKSFFSAFSLRTEVEPLFDINFACLDQKKLVDFTADPSCNTHVITYVENLETEALSGRFCS